MGLAQGDHRHVDHVDGDPLNNRRSNLRIVTKGQNGQNRPSNRTFAGKPTSSRFRGVSWDRQYRKWAANVRVNGTLKKIGRFTSEIDAANAASEYRQKMLPYTNEKRREQ